MYIVYNCLKYMEKLPQISPEPSRTGKLITMLTEVAEKYNSTRELRTYTLGAERFVVDSNLLREQARAIKGRNVRDYITQINPNETLRKVMVAENNNLAVGDALFTEAAVVVAAYILKKESTEENLEKFLEVCLKYADIRSNGKVSQAIESERDQE